MKEKIKEFFEKDIRKVILVFFILQFILCMFITPNRYDDEFYIRSITGRPIIEFVSERYNVWTSRVLIEFVLCFVLKTSRLLWILLQCLIMTLFGYSVMKIFVKDEKKESLIFMAALLFIYPFDRMSSAGWGATTVNYIWPLATAMYSLISLKKIWNGEKIKPYEYPFYIIALIFGCNQEQVCVLMTLIYLVFTVLLIIRDKSKINKFIIVQDILIILSLIFILTCPGNAIRKVDEIKTHYPNFYTLTIMDKLSLGVTSTISEFVLNTNAVFLTFSIFLAVVMFNMYKDKFVRAVSFIPLLFALSFGVFRDIVFRVFPYFSFYRDIIAQEKPMVDASNFTSLSNFLPLACSFIVLGSILACLLLISKKIGKSLPAIIFIIGVGTRVVMAFSPTIFASTNRTFIFLEYALIICTYLIFMEFYSNKEEKVDRKVQDKLVLFTKVMAGLQYVNMLYFIMITQLVA